LVKYKMKLVFYSVVSLAACKPSVNTPHAVIDCEAVMWPVQAVNEDIFIWIVRRWSSVNCF